MKLSEKTALTMVLALAMMGLGGCGTTPYLSAQVVNQQYSNPAWAPPYVPGVRYYYLPDIEAYYDLSNQDFVYLDKGEWLFSSTLPARNGGYDLYNGFTIALNTDVYQPWMHNQYYVSHYPRYYYRNKYSDHDQVRIRGFNENEAKPFYREEPEVRNRENERPDNNRQNNNNRNTQPSNPQATRNPQKVGYYGKDIGRPVKVQPQMREKAPRDSAHSRVTKERGGRGKSDSE